jgi:hypothetical protein
MIADVEALFTLRRVFTRGSHDEVLYIRLQPLSLDVVDIVSFVVPHKRCWPIGIAVAGIARDLNWVKTM